MTFRVLLIDDDRRYCENFELFAGEYFSITVANDGATAIRNLQSEQPDIVFLDYYLGARETGLDILRQIRKKDADIPVIVISEKTSVEVAVEAMKLGAYHYTSKYGSVKELLVIVKQELDRLRDRILLQKKLAEKYDPFLGESRAIGAVKQQISRFAQVDSPVLITGETGVGKELAAWEIHCQSKRNLHPFVTVNCSAVPETLFESEFFGHERGAFTGATARRMGYFELATGGSLFLDEIGTLSLAQQAKLLRTLENRLVRRLGSEREIQVDVRILSATNLDLKSAVADGRFRLDLMHRINILQLEIPPLRERPEDIQLLAEYFTEKFAPQTPRPAMLSREYLEFLKQLDWPGNVRELKNTMERFVLLGKQALTVANGWQNQGSGIRHTFDAKLLTEKYKTAKKHLLDEFRQFYFSGIIRKFNGNVTKAAEWMDVPRTTVYRGLKSDPDSYE